MSNEINDLLMNCEGVYIINVLDEAMSLNDDILNRCVKPKKGLYLPNNIRPILNLSDNTYYFENGVKVTDVNEVLSAEKNILNKDQEVILKGVFIKNRKNYILTKPNIPVVAVELIIGFIKNYITTITNIPDNKFSYSVINLLKPGENGVQDVLDDIYTLLDDVFMRLNEFIGKDQRHIYLFKEIGTSLLIEKICDYRVLEYYRLKQELHELKYPDRDN